MSIALDCGFQFLAINLLFYTQQSLKARPNIFRPIISKSDELCAGLWASHLGRDFVALAPQVNAAVVSSISRIF